MIEEPYRWMEAIANRREYIEHQLAGGSPIAALTYADGILLFTLGRERQKVFEIYDRIAMGGLGHPGDIERLRMAAIELTSTEGFTRSAQDVSLRRLAAYSMSPALKAAFEQVYGAPYLARLLFAELGRNDAPNLFLRLDYDGAIHTNGGVFGRTFEEFGVISGSAHATQQMEDFLREQMNPKATLPEALQTAMDAWTIGHWIQSAGDPQERPAKSVMQTHWREQSKILAVESAVLERTTRTPATWRALPEAEVRALLRDR